MPTPAANRRKRVEPMVSCVWLVLLLHAEAAGPPGGVAKPIPDMAPEPFEQVQKRLESSRGASVSSVCGSPFAPWGYRGRRSKNALRPYHTGSADRRWARSFANALMRSSDWDMISRFRGIGKPCDERHDAPLFVVALRRFGPTVYVLLSFEGRSAQVFEAGRPLGTVQLGDRADSLFALIQRALPDSIVRAMASPPSELPLGDSLGVYAPYRVDSLPHVLESRRSVYPPAARAEGIQGTVNVKALVGTDGRVQDAFVDTSIPALDDAALEAVWEWRFKPALSDGKPIAAWVLTPVRFSLH